VIQHHLPAALLLDHVAGTLPEAVGVLVATHLALCPACRAEVVLLEDAAGALIEDAGPAGDSAGLDALLARLDEPEAPPTVPPLPPVATDTTLPMPLRGYVGPFRDLPWKTTLPGVASRVELPLDFAGIPVTLERVRAGRVVPPHGHDGLEITLVLAGGYQDRGAGYARGDVSALGPETTHGLQIDDDGEDCLLLSVRSGARVPEGLYARIASWIGAL